MLTIYFYQFIKIVQQNKYNCVNKMELMELNREQRHYKVCKSTVQVLLGNRVSP